MPKSNTESVQDNSDQDIALRLFFKNPHVYSVFNKYAEIEQKISSKELYGDGEVELNSVFTDNVTVKIKYQDGLLSIKTTDDVDVFLSGTIPAKAVHIETMGGCALIDGCVKNLSMGLFIKANGTVLDMPITSQGFVAILPGSKAENTVQIKQPIDVVLLRIDAMDLLLGAEVQAGKTMLKCKLLHNFSDGKLLVGGQKRNLKQIDREQALDWDEAVDKHIFIEEHDQLKGKIYRLSESVLITGKIINEGVLSLKKAIIKGCNSIQFLPNGAVNLENVKLFSNEMLVSNRSTIAGSNTFLQLNGKLDIEGSCIIDGLVVHALDVTVPGILWGVTSLSMQIKENASFHGIVGAKQTIIKYKYLLATAVLGNEGLYHETFVNGGIIGTSSLTMEGLACVRTGGAYLYGPTIFLNSGIDVGLFSYIRTFNVVKNCLYEYCTLEGTLLCKPEYISALMSPNKLLRVAEMIGSNFPGLRRFVSFLNIGKMVVTGCKTALTAAFDSLRDNPDILRQLSNSCKLKLTSAFTSLRNDLNLLHQLSYLGQAGRAGATVIAKSAQASATSVAKSAQDGAAFFVNLAMGEWNSDRAKELVEILLQANGLRVYANTIASQATGALIFVNDMQNLTYTNPDFTFDNIKATASRTLESAKNLTVADALDASKNVGDNIAEAVGVKFEEAKNILETSESRAKFINDNFTVLKKNTTPSNKKPEDVSSGKDQPSDADEERITLAQAAKDVVLNQVSEILNAPTTIFNRVVGAVDAIQSISPVETASQLFTSTNEKVDAFMTAAKAVRNAEPTPFAIQAPTINEDFLWGMAKESAKLLAPSVYTTSFVSDTGGFMLTGNYIVNTGFYRNSGMVMALGTSVHSLYDSSNHGTIFSQRHTETARNRNNHGILSAAEASIFVSDNNEHGSTDASNRMIFDIKNQYVAPGAKFRSTGKTYGDVTGNYVSNGETDLRNGLVKVAGKVEYNGSSNAKAHNLEMKYNGDVTRGGKEDFDKCTLIIAGNNVTTSTGKFNHHNVDEVISGSSSDAAKLNKTAGTRTINGHITYEETSILNATGVDFNYKGGLERKGQEAVTGGSIFIEGTEENALPSSTYHDAVPQITTGDFISDGNLAIVNFRKEVGGKSTLGAHSDTVAVNVVLDSKKGCELNGAADLEQVVVKGNEKIKLSDTSIINTKNVHLISDGFEHEGTLGYEDILQITCKHAESTLDSTLIATTKDASYSVEADTVDFKGCEKHNKVVYKIKDMPIVELEELFHARGKHANKIVEKSIHVSSEMAGDATIVQSARGLNVAHGMSIPGKITVAEEITSGPLALQSISNDIELQKNVITQGDQHYEAAGSISKPGVVAQAKEGNVFLVAGAAIDNSHGGKIYAPQGIAHVEGASVDNDTYDIFNRSAIESKETFVKATSGRVGNRHGSIRGSKFVQVYATGKIDNNALEVQRWYGHGNATEYYGGEIIGGAGTEFSNGYGAIVDAGDTVNNHASTIGSEAHTYVHGTNGVTHWTAHSVFKNESRKYDHGAFNTIERTADGVLWAPATIFGAKNTICSSEGGVLIHGANTLAPGGSTIWSKGKHVTENATAILNEREEKTRIGLFHSVNKETNQKENVAIFQTKSGPIDIVSLNDGIQVTGAVFMGSPEAKPRLLFQAPGNISVNPAVLDGSFSHRDWSFNVNIAGQSIYGGHNGTLAQRLSSLDQTFSSARDFTKSRSPVDAMINGYNVLDGLSSLTNDIAQDGIAGTIAKRTGVSVGITNSQTVLKYQTLGNSSINFFDEVIFDSAHGDVELGVDIDHVRRLYVHANTFRVHGTELNSSMHHSSQTITATLSATGTMDGSAAVSFAESMTKSFTQNRIRVSILEVDARVAEIEGSDVTAEQTKGEVGTLITKPLIGSTKSKEQSFSASASGNVSGSISSSNSETYDARGVLRVTNPDGMQMKIGTHIEYGESGIVDAEGRALELPGTTIEHHDVDLHTKHKGFSAATNLVKIRDPESSYTVQTGVDTQNRVDSIMTTGVQNIKDEGHNFTLVNDVTREKLEQDNDKTNAPENAITRRLEASIVADAIAQLESTDYLIKPYMNKGTTFADNNDKIDKSDNKNKLMNHDSTRLVKHENFIEKRHAYEQTMVGNIASVNNSHVTHEPLARKSNVNYESKTPEQFEKNYGMKPTTVKVLWLYATNKLLPGDRAFVGQSIGESISDAVNIGEEQSWGRIRAAKQGVVEEYFNRGIRMYEQMCTQNGNTPNLTSTMYAGPVLSKVAMSVIPDTAGQFAVDAGMLIGAEPVAASTMWMYHSLKGGGIIKRINPSMIKFSQSSVNDWGAIADSMNKSGWKWWLEPIDVVNMKNGALVTLDNTRVLAAHDAAIEVRAIIRNFDDPLPKDLINRFKTKKDGLPSTWGEAAQFRINNQNKDYRTSNVSGSNFIGRGTKCE